jgi:hypothetical protein
MLIATLFYGSDLGDQNTYHDWIALTDDNAFLEAAKQRIIFISVVSNWHLFLNDAKVGAI